MAKKSFKKSLFIFRRDLRLQDNLGLNAALTESDEVIACFIFDPSQIGAKNKYRSDHAIQFMIESLKDLASQLSAKKGHLYLFYGNPADVLKKLISREKIEAVHCNRDYTPFSIKRDKALHKICEQAGVAFTAHADALLNEPEDVKTSSGNPYTVFTAFYKHCLKHLPMSKPSATRVQNFYKKPIISAVTPSIFKKILSHENPAIAVRGGSKHAHTILRSLKTFKNYAKEHDIPTQEATTLLSAYIKFGCVSIREVAAAIEKNLSKNHPLMRQLYWRDFYYHVAFHSPHVFGHAYRKKFYSLSWKNSKAAFKKWCEGKTGFPIVDAGMRQLNETGFMHNRVRMIVASFLTKDLHIDWRWGEKYFAQQLVDYDPAVNNGNWQWTASTGCDAQPYFRIFNPWLQQKKFDSQCEYIKTWVPELKNIEPKIIHHWFKEKSPSIKEYPRPMVDHEIERKITLILYKKA